MWHIMSNPDWHFPRTEFAWEIYSLLASGPIQGASIFGLRRTGKTQFLTHDLASLAKTKGHRVVYASFWEISDLPLENLLAEFKRALRPRTNLEIIKSIAQNAAMRLKLKTPDGFAEMEVDLSKSQGSGPKEQLLLLDEYCERLASNGKPAFLLFDEFQELENARNAKQIIGTLRTAFDKHRDKLVAVFAGSSKKGLEKMFTERDAPFFRFAKPIDFPPISEGFVNHQLSAILGNSQEKLGREEALKIFNKFDRNPYFFQSFLTEINAHRHISKNDAFNNVQAKMQKEFEFQSIWDSLDTSQRVMAWLLANNTKTDEEFITGFPNRVLSTSFSRQDTLEQLSNLDVAENWRGKWQINDSLFKIWIKNQPPPEF